MGEPVEQDRIERIREHLDERDIRYIVFDLDGTLLDTTQYFDKHIMYTISSCTQVLQIPDVERFTQQVFSCCGQIHRQVGRPMLVQELTYLALMQTLEEEKKKRSERQMQFLKAYILACFADFYFKSPEPFPQTLEILNTVVRVNKPFFVYTNTQEPAAGIKVAHLIRRYREEYGTRLHLPYYATDISQRKDSLGWQMAANNLFLNLEQALVIGDNPNADIEASRQAGCRNHVLIDRGIETPTQTDELLIVQNIGQIFDYI